MQEMTVEKRGVQRAQRFGRLEDPLSRRGACGRLVCLRETERAAGVDSDINSAIGRKKQWLRTRDLRENALH